MSWGTDNELIDFLFDNRAMFNVSLQPTNI